MKKKFSLFLLICTAFVLLSVTFSSCTKLKSDIVGQWECEVPGEKIFTYDFMADGTGNYTVNSDEFAFYYEVRANKVTITIKGGTSSYALKYEDEKLVYKSGDIELVFIKRDSKD